MNGYEPSVIEIYMWERGIVLREISLIAFDRESRKIRAVGYDVRNLTGADVEVVSPLKNGQIAEWDEAEKMMEYFMYKAYRAIGKRFPFRKPRIAVCMMPDATGMEKKAMEELMYASGARKVILSELSLEEFLTRSSKKECDLIVSIHPERQ